MFPNQFNVYLHDTPGRGLFAKSLRDFSSGCVRIEKPLELAEFLLKNDPSWSRQRIIETINAKAEKTVILPEAMPIHLLYWTGWADSAGVIHFRKDIYNRDSVLYQALAEESPKLE
jgi:murein L,D-transpeptidase YcbB/YkuD